MADLQKIDSVTVGSGGASSITFSNIPQTYTDLIVKFSARSTTANSTVGFRFNGDSGSSSYNAQAVFGNGSSALADRSDPTTQLRTMYLPTTTQTSNTFSNGEIYIPNYTSSNYKTTSADVVTENNATSANTLLNAGIWSNTAAITSIVFSLTSGDNLAQYSTATLYGVSSVTSGSRATGGVIYYDSTYCYHVFSYSGTFTPTQSITADYLIVAGGGGGPAGGAGGGAGGLRAFASQSLTAQAYTVTIGAGGVGTSGDATSGSTTTFNSTSVSGGGNGGNYAANGGAGGSGGGGGPWNQGPTRTGGSGNSGSYSPVEGYAGGAGSVGDQWTRGGGGGGGAAGAGTAASGSTGGNGGAGANSYNSISFTSWLTATGAGVSGYLAGGGGGLTQTSVDAAQALGGIGGGGLGSVAINQSNSKPPTNGRVSTGSGGGGGTAWGSGSRGGSGIVIIRYAI